MKSLKSLGVAIAVALSLTLTACGSDNGGGGGGTPTFTPPTLASTETSATSTSDPTTTTTTTTARKPIVGGANAGPLTLEQSYPGTYNPSAAAEQDFQDWWNYEVQTGPGRNRPYQSVYTDAVSVCANRALGTAPAVIAEAVKQNKGYSLSDAAALVAAAFRALCPKSVEQNISTTSLTGYQTKFDENIASAYYRVTTDPQLNWHGSHPTLYQVGWFTKFTCFHLESNLDAGNLIAYLAQYKNERYGTSYLAGSDQRTVEILVVDVVNAACTGYSNKLGPAWYN